MAKLAILADAAKYDVSCSSSGSKRKNSADGLGDATGMGICHSYTTDGRCISLLKILLTNHCIFDCIYCVSRRSNDVKRAAFTVEEVVELTIEFYKRNFIEGLFLSSGIFRNPDTTMERLVRVAKTLRTQHKFNGYIHLKSIPGASNELMHEAGLWADRLSVNIELPTEQSLKLLAPEKNYADIRGPMEYLSQAASEHIAEKKIIAKKPMFMPAGQSTQMVVGATNETDGQILGIADALYRGYGLKRVYYSGYIPVADDARLPAISSAPPLLRENRLYQADWLMRFYGFTVGDIVPNASFNLETDIDPKLSWALRNLDLFPINVNSASKAMLLKVPGFGLKTVDRIISARKFGIVRPEHLQKFGAAWNRAQYFVEGGTKLSLLNNGDSSALRRVIQSGYHGKWSLKEKGQQAPLF